MRLPVQLLGLLMLWIPGAKGDIVMTQSPLSLSANSRESASISCRSSESLLHSNGKIYFYWFHQKPGQPLRQLFYYISNRDPGVPDRFSSTGSGSDFTLRISNVDPEDVGVYYCFQALKYPHTVIQP